MGAKAEFVQIDVPNGVSTQAWAINSKGDVVGNYVDSQNQAAGFIRTASGVFETFSPGGYISSLSINGDDTVAGTLVSGNVQSFVRKRGKIKEFQVRHSDTSAFGINDSGYVVGNYTASTGYAGGFRRDPTGHRKAFSAPGDVHGTTACCINSAGIIAGEYYDAAGVPHMYLRRSSHKYTVVDIPGATIITVRGITDDNAVAGTSTDATNQTRGFLRTKDGTVTVFDAPDDAFGTWPLGINSSNQIVGWYEDSKRGTHSFVREADGSFTTFDYPGSQQSWATGINDTGEVVGYFADQNGLHGYVKLPEGIHRGPLVAGAN
jgi:hypothetical protein